MPPSLASTHVNNTDIKISNFWPNVYHVECQVHDRKLSTTHISFTSWMVVAVTLDLSFFMMYIALFFPHINLHSC